MPPLGIMYLAAWLRKHGVDATIIDLAGVPDWKDALTKEGPAKLDGCDMLGITATTPQYGLSRQIADNIRVRGYEMPIVVGGIHVTSLVHANEMAFLEHKEIDSFCIGEGYNAVTKMADDLKGGAKLSRVYTEPILKDVNSLPFAARDLLDIQSYSYKLGDTPATTFYSQYGCPYACQYCESPMAGSFTVRAMTPKRIQDEVRQIRDDFGIHGIMFFDDEMNLDKKRMLGICERLRELGDIVWRGFMVTAKFDEELGRACHDSGCYEVASGIESGSPTILRNIRKPATRDINVRFIRTAKKAGLRVKAFMIVGLPSESWRSIYESYQFLDELRREGHAPDDIDVSVLQVYPGAPFYSNPQDIEFEKDWDKSWYKSSPDQYVELIQVKTAQMSKYDLICARNLLEYHFKQQHWLRDSTGRKDLDRVYEKNDVAESIRYAEHKINEVVGKPIF